MWGSQGSFGASFDAKANAAPETLAKTLPAAWLMLQAREQNLVNELTSWYQ